MHPTESPCKNNIEVSIYTKLARITFLLYMFFIFFGTSLPFRDRPSSIEEISTSNTINQIVFTLLFLMSVLCLIPRGRELSAFIVREKFLSIFLFWCLLSVCWSEFSFVSFKRLFQIFTTVSVTLALFLNIRTPDDSLKYLKYILLAYIPITYLAIAFVPGAIDPQHATWRGLTVGKNYLGQAAIVCALIWFYAFQTGSFLSRTVSFVMLILSIILLFGSTSMTAILTFFILVFGGALSSIDRIFRPLGIGSFFSTMIIFFSFSLLLVAYFWASDLFDSGFVLIGKDSTFTGRTELWGDLFNEAKKHLLVGRGFSGFWVVENENLTLLYEKYVWLPNEAHLGYLDILIETGLIGLVLLLLMIFFYFKNLVKLNTSHFWKWLFIAALIVNFQESTLFRQNVLTGVLFNYAYLALYAEIIYRRKCAGDNQVIRDTNQ